MSDEIEADEARRIARAKAFSPWRLLSELDQVDLYDRDLLDEVRRHKEELLPSLRHAMDTRSGRAKINACCLVLELGDGAGTKGLLDSVASEDPNIRLLAMTRISHLPYHSEKGGYQVPIDRTAVFAAIEPFLETTELRIRELTLEVLEKLGTEEADRLVSGLIDHPNPKIRLSVIRWLAMRGEDKGSLDATDTLLQSSTDRNSVYPLTLSLKYLAEKGDEQIRTRACWIAMRFVRGSLGDADNYTANHVRFCLDAVEAAAPPNEPDFLVEIIESGLLGWVRGHALERLAELEGDRGVRRLREALLNPDLRLAAAEGLTRLARGSADPEVIDALVAMLDGENSPKMLAAIAAALIAVGEMPRGILERIADRADPGTTMSFHWLLNGLGPKDLADRMAAAGAMATSSESKLAEYEERWRKDHQALYILYGLLLEDERLCAFDCKTGDSPADHAELVRNLGDISGGSFAPEDVSQTIEPDGDCKIRFVWNDGGHAFIAQNMGRYYDLRSVLDALNGVLAETGHDGRFFQIYGEGVTGFVLFASNDKFITAARELAIPLEGDPDAARRAGIAYTNYVLSTV